MNFGIIGCSRVARRRFLPALAASAKARLSFVGSRDREKARAYADEFGGVQFGSYDEVLASDMVDAIYVSTPPLLHTEWVVKAARAGKHIICEKPAFPTLEEAHAAVAACRKAGVRLFENYAFLYHPQHARARSLLPRIGRLERISARYLYPLPPAGDIRLKPELGGGVFHDSFGYPLALALHYFGEQPLAVSGAETRDAALGIDTAADMELRFSNNRMLSARVHMGSSEYASSYTLEGPQGSIEVCRAFAVDADKPACLIFHTVGGEEEVMVPPASQFRLALEDFCAAVREEAERNFEDELLARAEMKDTVAKHLVSR